MNHLLWGLPLIILLLGTGLWLTFHLRVLQLFCLPLAVKLIFKSKDEGEGDVSSFGVFVTAVGAVIGTGNIIGVTTALKFGGPGALFWMWVGGFLGMVTKYAEGLLAIKYRTTDGNGQIIGGPMYYIERGLGPRFKPLAMFFAFGGLAVALFGIGSFPQINAIVASTQASWGVSPLITAVIITIITSLVTIGGIHSISKFAVAIVPAMAILYITASSIVLITFAERIPHALSLIFDGAFSPTAAGGGFLGATVMMTLRNGVARGMFSNESGMGSAPILAAAAKVKWPAEQGLVSMMGTFIDTLVICSLTGMSLLVTGVWNSNMADGAPMAQAALNAALPYGLGSLVITLSLILFAFTTIIAWNFYGDRCIVYLFGVKAILPFRILFISIIGLGAFIKLDMIWTIADIVNALMVLPNLLALLGLSGVVTKETHLYWQHRRAENAGIKKLISMKDKGTNLK